MDKNLGIEYRNAVVKLSDSIDVDAKALADTFKEEQGFLVSEFNKYQKAGNDLVTYTHLTIAGIGAVFMSLPIALSKTNSLTIALITAAIVAVPTLALANKVDEKLNTRKYTRKLLTTEIENNNKSASSITL